MSAALYPIGNPAAIASGAQKVPVIPGEYYWLMLTAAANKWLGSNYTVEQIQLMDPEQLLLIETYLNVTTNKGYADSLSDEDESLLD